MMPKYKYVINNLEFCNMYNDFALYKMIFIFFI